MAAIETAFIAPIAVDQEQWPCHLKLLLQHCPWKYSTRSDRFSDILDTLTDRRRNRRKLMMWSPNVW